MVELVRPGLLGSPQDFEQLFVNIIQDGVHNPKNKKMVKKMHARHSALNTLTSGVMHRRTVETAITPSLRRLPPRTEYVVRVRLSLLQVELYRRCLDELTRRGYRFFAIWRALMRIWNCPTLLLGCRSSRSPVGSTQTPHEPEQAVEDGDEDDAVPRTEALEELQDNRWWHDLTIDPSATSGKVEVALLLIGHALSRSEKVVFFANSLAVLEHMAKRLTDSTRTWTFPHGQVRLELGTHILGIQGSDNSSARNHRCARFNDPASPVSVLLVSIKVCLLEARAQQAEGGGECLPVAASLVAHPGWNANAGGLCWPQHVWRLPLYPLRRLLEPGRGGCGKRKFAVFR
jgi:SNF2 family DNA or RNA helicase